MGKILKINGFDYLLDDIQRAGGNIDIAIDKAVKAGAAELEAQLRAECQAADIPDSITGEIRTKHTKHGNKHKCSVGWDIGEYNPDNLSTGYKALFLNYGTPHRRKHGKIKARGFITKAKRKARRKVKLAQAAALDEILRGI
jgi:hypothetical protein